MPSAIAGFSRRNGNAWPSSSMVLLQLIHGQDHFSNQGKSGFADRECLSMKTKGLPEITLAPEFFQGQSVDFES
jgi:hypothetical protein